jgi:hypothetical protein
MSTPRASRLRAFAARLRGFVRGPRQDDVFDDEVREHLRLLAERFMAQGMPRVEALVAARRQFGNTTLLQEDRRALQTLASAEALWHDLRYALRTLGRSPGFAAVSIVTLGLGIGAAAAIYSVIHNVMLSPFPYRDADRMVFPRIYDPRQGPEVGRQGYAAAEVLEFVENSRVFDGTTAALGEGGVLYRHRTGTEALNAAHVTPGTFEFFGLPALHGRVPIACSNVANLMLARATVREKEFALRTALPPYVVPSESVIALNAPVLAVTLGITALTALLCGLAPALQAFRRDLSDPLRDSGRGTSSGLRGRRLRDGLVVLEVALSVTLLIGAGLLMRSFVALRDAGLGLQPDRVFTVGLVLPEDRYATAEQVTAFLQPLLARVKALPGVVHAAASTGMPPFNAGSRLSACSAT